MTNNTSLPCDIVQDLLPSYVDGILSDTSACAVSKHLQSCKACHDMYDDMVKLISILYLYLLLEVHNILHLLDYVLLA